MSFSLLQTKCCIRNYLFFIIVERYDTSGVIFRMDLEIDYFVSRFARSSLYEDDKSMSIREYLL